MTASTFNGVHALMLASLTLASSALAGVYITNPVANTTARPGELLTIRWVDDGTTPHLASIGPSQIALYTGSATQQTLLQQLAANIDVSTANSVDAWIDTNVGPNGEYYFIRITSNSLKDTTHPQYPYQSYSARFTLNNMNGDFNTSVWQQLAATSSSTPSTPTANATLASSVSIASQSQSAGIGNSLTTAITNGVTSENVDASATTTTAASTGTSIVGGNARSAATSTSPRSSSTTSTTQAASASTTQASSAAGTRLSAPFSFKAPQVLARAKQPGSPEGRTAALMVTSVLFGVFGFGLAVAL